jgi:hypothetical protein
VNYGFWLLVGQSQQTGLMAAQMRQLAGIQSQLAQQQFIQQQQAALQQVLFDTEQFARAVDGWAQQDPFAAGFLAHMRMRSTGEVRPEYFHAIDHKRAWSAVRDRLAARWQAVEQNAQWRDLALRLTRAVDTLVQLQSSLGQDPQSRLAEVRAKLASTESGKRLQLTAALVAMVLALGTCAGSSIYVTATNDRSGTCFGTVFVIGFVLTVIVTLSNNHTKGKAVERLRSEVRFLEDGLRRWQAFAEDPEGGPLLDRMVADHPLIGRS